MSYASAKGRAIQRPAATAKREPTPLSEAEQQRVAANRAMVIEHMPEAVQFIKDLHAEGLIDGWRNVTRCTLLDREKHE